MRLVTAVVLVVLLGAGCGGSVRQETFDTLQSRVGGVRDAAEADDVVLAGQRLDDLRAEVTRFRQADLLTEIEAQRILTAALQVQANLIPLTPVVPEPPAVAPAPASGAGSNAGGSISGADGQPGAKGKKGEKGKKGKEEDD